MKLIVKPDKNAKPAFCNGCGVNCINYCVNQCVTYWNK